MKSQKISRLQEGTEYSTSSLRAYRPEKRHLIIDQHTKEESVQTISYGSFKSDLPPSISLTPIAYQLLLPTTSKKSNAGHRPPTTRHRPNYLNQVPQNSGIESEQSGIVQSQQPTTKEPNSVSSSSQHDPEPSSRSGRSSSSKEKESFNIDCLRRSKTIPIETKDSWPLSPDEIFTTKNGEFQSLILQLSPKWRKDLKKWRSAYKKAKCEQQRRRAKKEKLKELSKRKETVNIKLQKERLVDLKRQRDHLKYYIEHDQANPGYIHRLIESRKLPLKKRLLRMERKKMMTIRLRLREENQVQTDPFTLEVAQRMMALKLNSIVEGTIDLSCKGRKPTGSECLSNESMKREHNIPQVQSETFLLPVEQRMTEFELNSIEEGPIDLSCKGSNKIGHSKIKDPLSQPIEGLPMTKIDMLKASKQQITEMIQCYPTSVRDKAMKWKKEYDKKVKNRESARKSRKLKMERMNALKQRKAEVEKQLEEATAMEALVLQERTRLIEALSHIENMRRHTVGQHFQSNSRPT